MNRREAALILLRTLVPVRRLSYEKLAARVGRDEHVEIRGSSGRDYQLELQFVWDDQPNGAVRVIGSIDDGGWRACCPLSTSFLAEPGQSERRCAGDASPVP